MNPATIAVTHTITSPVARYATAMDSGATMACPIPVSIEYRCLPRTMSIPFIDAVRNENSDWKPITPTIAPPNSYPLPNTRSMMGPPSAMRSAIGAIAASIVRRMFLWTNRAMAPTSPLIDAMRW